MTGLLLLLVLGALSGAAQPVTVFLVRHAEKAVTPEEDPSLTSAGKLRAKKLANILRDAEIAAVFTSELKRTIETAQPTADRFKLKLTQVPAVATSELRKRILALKGKAVLVSGHSVTVPALIKAFGGPRDIVITESEYDRLFIMHVTSATSATLVPLRYGLN